MNEVGKLNLVGLEKLILFTALFFQELSKLGRE
jgi:hypothetical protein